MIEIPALEYHLAHGCNLSCQQCSHYSNFHIAGKLPTLEDADAEFSMWSPRFRPKRFALLGGEPLLNPQVLQHIKLARRHWKDCNLMLVTNGFFLHRFPELPSVLVDTSCRLEVSQHGAENAYLEQFRAAKKIVWQWRNDYPGIQIRIRQSHRGWMRQYQINNGKPMPFNSNPAAAYRVCMQKTCTQLFRNCIWKCPALAYHMLVADKLGLEAIPAWRLFQDYKACSASATDEELRAFMSSKEIPQCRLCPNKRVSFAHPNPLEKNELQ